MTDILAEAWRLYTKHFVVILGVILVVYVPIELLSSYMDAFVFENDLRKSYRFSQLLEALIGIIATAGVIFVGLMSQQGESPEAGRALSRGVQAWGRMFWTRLLSGLCVLLGLILFIIPGLYLFVRLLLIEPVTCCEKISGISAIQRSYDLTQGRFWTLVGLGLVLLGLVMAMLVAMFVGMFGLYLVMPEFDHWLFDAATSLLIDIVAAYATLCIFAAYAQFAFELGQVRQYEAERAGLEFEGNDGFSQ